MSEAAKRLFDVAMAAMAMGLLSPLLAVIALAIYVHDHHSPLYVASRVGRGGRPFRMVKFRSMVVNADRSGVTSTAANDSRITPIGRYIRTFKLDELVQFWNVLLGDMSVVGPRPNVASGVALYTAEERRLLGVRPGITDFASIVFSDEAKILAGSADPDLAYDQLIRPWKSRLGLFYLDQRSLRLDLILIYLTALAMASPSRALQGVNRVLIARGAPEELVRVARRRERLVPHPPPGAAGVVISRGAGAGQVSAHVAEN